MKNLLDITLRRFAALALLLVTASLPLAYWATWRIYLDEVDESLAQKTSGFIQRYASRFTPADIAVWNDYQYDMQISPAAPKDTAVHWLDETVYDSLEQESVPFRSLLTPLPGLAGGHYQIRVRSSVLETEDFVLALMLLYGALIGALLLGWLWLTRRISKRLWQPFYDTLEKIRRFNLEHGEAPVFPFVQIVEFQQLNTAVTELAESNLRSWQQQKAFFENASHELQTPLAVLRAQLDLLMQDSSLDEAQSRSVADLAHSVNRLARLNRNLLLLAKIDNRIYTDKTDVDVAGSVVRQLVFLQPLAETSDIRVKADILRTTPVRANAVLLDSLLSNLLTNAFRYTSAGGIIEVILENGQLEIANTGAEPLDPKQVFSRFASGRSEGEGTGLGLAIAQRIAEVSGWNLTYRWESGRHVFSIKW